MVLKVLIEGVGGPDPVDISLPLLLAPETQEWHLHHLQTVRGHFAYLSLSRAHPLASSLPPHSLLLLSILSERVSPLILGITDEPLLLYPLLSSSSKGLEVVLDVVHGFSLRILGRWGRVSLALSTTCFHVSSDEGRYSGEVLKRGLLLRPLVVTG